MVIPYNPYKEDMGSKHPSVIRDYTLRCANLIPAGGSISSVTAVATPFGLLVGTPAAVGTDYVATVSLGDDGVDYDIIWTVTLSNGRKEIAIMTVHVDSSGIY